MTAETRRRQSALAASRSGSGDEEAAVSATSEMGCGSVQVRPPAAAAQVIERAVHDDRVSQVRRSARRSN